MITFYINGTQADIQIDEEKTVGDVLHSFELTCEENNAAVIGIALNGTNITADTFDSESKKELSDSDRFDFSVVTEQNIKDSFFNLAKLFDNLSAQMESVPVDLQNGKNREVSESIKVLADSINQFCHIAALASLFPKAFSSPQIDGKNFNEFFKDFSAILLDFEQALQNNDSVLIGDLSEYEICPRLKAISQSLAKI